MSLQDDLALAAKHLAAHDPALAPIIAEAGIADFELRSDYYASLVNSIIGQQLSVKAASTIKQRFRDLYGGVMPSPETVVDTTVEQLRAVGFSNAKARYVRDLAEHVIAGKVRFDRLDSQSNEEIIAELTEVKGIGEWTVHMFLMFSMGRLDVLATGDLGVRNGIRQLYDFADVPTPAEVTKIAETNHWHPYESVACWYVWRSLDNAPS